MGIGDLKESVVLLLETPLNVLLISFPQCLVADHFASHLKDGHLVLINVALLIAGLESVRGHHRLLDSRVLRCVIIFDINEIHVRTPWWPQPSRSSCN